MRVCICEGCGHREETQIRTGMPMLLNGAVLQLREQGDEEFKESMEFCSECRTKILGFIVALMPQYEAKPIKCDKCGEEYK